MRSVEQAVTNEKRFRKADHKLLIEYINWSELVEDFSLKAGDLDYSEFKTHQVDPIAYALNKMKDKCQDRLEYNINYDYSKYKLVIN